MPPTKKIITSDEPVLLALLREEIARMLDAQLDRETILQMQRDRLRRDWDEPPVIVSANSPPRHFHRDRYPTLEAAMRAYKLDKPPTPVSERSAKYVLFGGLRWRVFSPRTLGASKWQGNLRLKKLNSGRWQSRSMRPAV